MTDLKVPDYRVRLFLSVDLTGSTAFKANTQSVFKWRKVFSRFYEDFPNLFIEEYKNCCNQIANIGAPERESLPQLWKTIGDEILFVNRVTSLTQLGAYITAFSQALVKFGASQSDGLNTKGNGWLAAFPSPNCSIPINRIDAEKVGFNDLPTEEFELEVDQNPSKFDFLGKGIDGGFRISRNSDIDSFTISPALGFLLARAKKNTDSTGFDNLDFLFHEPQRFKGVIGEKPYPIVCLATNRDEKAKELKDLEAQLLNRPTNVSHEKLQTFLEKFIDFHKIEKPLLPLSFSDKPSHLPDHYLEYKTAWHEEYSRQKEDDKSMQQEDGLTTMETKNNKEVTAVLARTLERVFSQIDNEKGLNNNGT